MDALHSQYSGQLADWRARCEAAEGKLAAANVQVNTGGGCGSSYWLCVAYILLEMFINTLPPGGESPGPAQGGCPAPGRAGETEEGGGGGEEEGGRPGGAI